MTCTTRTATRAPSPWTLATRRLGFATACALLAACAAPSTHFYTLAEPTPQTMARQAAPEQAPLVIEFTPVGVPERMARPQLLVREANAPSAQVRLLEFHRWSSSFENELRDALSSGVAARLGAVDASRGLRPAGQAGWRIAVQVRQFDLVEGSQAEAALSWTLHRPDAAPGARGVACQWSDREAAGPGVDALAQAAQRLTARAADAIARDVAAARSGADASCARRSAQNPSPADSAPSTTARAFSGMVGRGRQPASPVG